MKTSTTRSQTQTEQHSSDDPFTDYERQATGYLFYLLKAHWPSEFALIWPTEKELNVTKRAFAKRIGKYTQFQINEAVEYLVNQATKGDADFARPDPKRFLEVAQQLNHRVPAHSVFLPSPKETEEVRQKRLKKSRLKLSAIREILN